MSTGDDLHAVNLLYNTMMHQLIPDHIAGHSGSALACDRTSKSYAKPRLKIARGFTLIELLVVIAIIGVLSSVVTASMNKARQKSRDTRRLTDLKAIQTAFELYYDDNNSYPHDPSGPFSQFRSECPSWGGYSRDDVAPGLVPTYLKAFPQDPQMNSATNSCCYIVITTGVNYKITARCSSIDFADPTIYRSIDPRRDGGTDNCARDDVAPTAISTSSSGGLCF